MPIDKGVREMTKDGEKKILELLTSMNDRLTQIEGHAKWLREVKRMTPEGARKSLADLIEAGHFGRRSATQS